MYHPDFTMGRPGYFDISVWNPLQSAINEATDHSGVAAEAGVRAKNSLHEISVRNCGGMFFPLVVECFVCWSQKSLEYLKDIARKTTICRGPILSKAVTNLHEHLSVRLWARNARMILGRLYLEARDVDLLH